MTDTAIKNILEGRKALRTLSVLLQTTTVSKQDAEQIANYIPKLGSALEKFNDWNSSTLKKEEYRIAPYYDAKVSSSGDIYSLRTGELLVPFWYDGDLRVKTNNTLRRCVDIIVKAWSIKAPGNANYMIAFKDGDRRNLHHDNIIWTKSVPMTDMEIQAQNGIYLIEDISRRLVDSHGDIAETFEFYNGSKPKISTTYINTILKKEFHPEISDRFFTLDRDGVLIPVSESIVVEPELEEDVEEAPDPVAVENTEVDTEVNTDEDSVDPTLGIPTTVSASNGIDVYGLLMSTHDINICVDMLKDKVKRGQIISEQEKEIMYISCMDQTDHNALWYMGRIKQKYGYELPATEIGYIRRTKSIAFREIMKIFKEAK